MKLTSIIIVALILGLTPACAQNQDPSLTNSCEAPTKIKKFPTLSFVKIERIIDITECNKEIKNSSCIETKYKITGSGISIKKIGNDSLVLTAAHVCDLTPSPKLVKHVKKYSIELVGINTLNKSKKAKVVFGTFNDNDLTDLCLLYIKDLDTVPISLAPKEPEVGDFLFSIGSPMGVFHPPTVPILHGIYSGPVDNINVLITVPAIGGSSGAGVLNDDKELVGIIFASVVNFNHISLASSFKTTMAFINRSLTEFNKNKSKFVK